MAIVTDLLANLLKGRATVLYPDEERIIPEASRGSLSFVRDLCVGCGLCWRVCPAAAIEPARDEKGVRPVFHVGRCIFCYLCVEVCPRKAIKGSKEQAPIAVDKTELVVR